MADPTHAQISARAPALYLRRGSQPGRALDDWLQAEREIKEEAARAAKFSAPSSFAPPPTPVSPHAGAPARPAPATTGSFAPPLPPAKAPIAPTKPLTTPPPARTPSGPKPSSSS